ncbi:ACP S-malonyltransferase [Candidatus Pelagibacter sp.]|nr:ACP S-malonyltransferase [Candidatus Pelagibacter sp.]
MFSVLFPGQGSQIVGMAKEFYDNFDYVRDYFSRADEILKKKISKIILDGPKEDLEQTINTQPSIFLVSYSIYKVIENETEFNLNKAKFFAGHSLGEYSALCCADSIEFEQTINLLESRGSAMQNAVPIGEGGMVAILGVSVDEINELLRKNKDKFVCYIANDNSIGQIVVSGKLDSLNMFCNELKNKNFKFIKLPVSSPFHCPLMNKATNTMKEKINETIFKDPKVEIISNVTANPTKRSEEIKRLLIDQIEKPVRWRESVNKMIESNINHFIEIGPGKVLSGLVKRINRNVKLNQVNNIEDIKLLTND